VELHHFKAGLNIADQSPEFLNDCLRNLISGASLRLLVTEATLLLWGT
jgi:hypothetical protein